MFEEDIKEDILNVSTDPNDIKEKDGVQESKDKPVKRNKKCHYNGFIHKMNGVISKNKWRKFRKKGYLL